MDAGRGARHSHCPGHTWIAKNKQNAINQQKPTKKTSREGRLDEVDTSWAAVEARKGINVWRRFKSEGTYRDSRRQQSSNTSRSNDGSRNHEHQALGNKAKANTVKQIDVYKRDYATNKIEQGG